MNCASIDNKQMGVNSYEIFQTVRYLRLSVNYERSVK